MNKRKILAAIPLVTILFSVGYFAVNNWVTAEENEVVDEEDQEENGDLVIAPQDEEEEEIEDAEKLFDQLTKRLEKAELKLEKAPASMVITSKGKVTMVNVDFEALADGTNGDGEVLTVELHGLTFQVDASGAKIYAGGKQITISDLEEGDKLLIKGIVDPATGIIEASRIYNRSAQRQSIQNLRLRIQELLQRIEELRAQLQSL